MMFTNKAIKNGQYVLPPGGSQPDWASLHSS